MTDLSSYRILLDVPATEAQLGFDRYAGALSDIIRHSEPRFAIGLFGPWGSGKTTLMNAIAKALGDAVVRVEFSAWRYEREAELIIPLLDTVREGLTEWAKRAPPGAARASKKTAEVVRRVVRGIIAGTKVSIGSDAIQVKAELDLGKVVESVEKPTGEDDAQVSTLLDRSIYHLGFRALRTAFETFEAKTGGGRIVVFIDDLDRCLPQGALDVMESMKLFFDLPGFVFVVGLDNRIVEASVDVKYREFAAVTGPDAMRVRGADYVKKIFQVPFHLPQARVEQLPAFIEAAIKQSAVGEQQASELRIDVTPHLSFIGADGAINPRDLKRYVNAYVIARKFNPDLDKNRLLAVQTLGSRPDWAPLNRALLAYGELFIDAVRNAAGLPSLPETPPLTELDDELVGLPADFRDYVAAPYPGAFPPPGAALLAPGDVGAYVATTASGTIDPLALQAVRTLVNLRSRLRDEAGDPPARMTADEEQAALSGLNAAADQFQKLSSSPQIGALIGEVTSIREAFTTLQADVADADARERRAREVRSIRQRLQVLVRRLLTSARSQA
ncbi:MAG TPA: P-loop NTPase fold protein [Caulobacteraceae bacterium]|jgi:energy-coupling factor transporter ATP-binding protein EcfA2